jgi:mRNA interferase RelE/StbE
VIYRVEFDSKADEDLEDITDNRVREVIIKRAYQLKDAPEKQGKPMTGDLKGLYSVRAAGQRYRIIYRVKVVEPIPPPKKQKNSEPTLEGIVTIVVIGIRKEGSRQDVYKVARRRLGKK